MKDLSPDIQSLLESERGVVPPAPDGARERVLSRVHATVGLAAPVALASAPAPATASAGAGSSALPLGAKWAAAVLAGVVASTVIYLAVRSPQPPAPSSVAAPALVAGPAAQPTSPAPAIVTAAPVAAAPAAVPTAEPPAVAGPVVADDPSAVHRLRAGQHLRLRGAIEQPGDFAAERKLLDKAQAALTAGNARSALEITRQHARSYPHGQLIDMRESLAIHALVIVGERPNAEARANSFRRRFPNSIFLPAVDAVLQ